MPRLVHDASRPSEADATPPEKVPRSRGRWRALRGCVLAANVREIHGPGGPP